MTRLILAESISHDPYFNLSFEKYLFDNVAEDELVLYFWQNQKTVVCGRNQNIHKECSLTALSENGGKAARRLSGGGAVYHDLGNLNVSFIAKESAADTSRDFRIIKRAVESCAETDHNAIKTELSGRNDLTADGRKFSGSAFYRADGTVCHHCTLMVDLDTAAAEQYLTVSREKLQSKGVDSVRSRVINLKELIPGITVDSLRLALREACLSEFGVRLFDSTLTVGGKTLVKATGFSGVAAAGSMLTMLQALSEGRDFFGSDKWLFGKNPAFTNSFGCRFDWGEIEFNFRVTGGIVSAARVYSDSLYPDLIFAVESSLPGTPYTAPALISAVTRSVTDEGMNAEAIKNDLITLITDSL